MSGSAIARYVKQPKSENANRLLAIGASDHLVQALHRAGWLVDGHELDLNPAANLAGRPFTPPVTAWPVPTATYDTVLLLDQLAHVVDDEEAIAEAARVLKPGGRLVVRVPQAGPLAWLDAFNLYRYLRDFTRRGRSLPETRGIGWRRHYARRDFACLFRDQFHVTATATAGIGLADAVHFVLLVILRWLLRWNRGYELARPAVAAVARADERLSAGPLGYHLVVIAERTSLSTD